MVAGECQVISILTPRSRRLASCAAGRDTDGPSPSACEVVGYDLRFSGNHTGMERVDDILMLPVEGDLDVATVPPLSVLLERRLAAGCQRIILNLAKTTFVDSMGMGLILRLAREMHEHGGLLSLVNVSDSVYRALCIARIVDFVPVSGASPKPPIPALDPTVRALWHGTMRVDRTRLACARDRLGELLRQTDLTPDEVFDLTLAGGEALGNAVDHTDAEGVLLTVSVYPDRVMVEVTDCGEGFELAPDEEPPDCGEGAMRGRGIKLMRMLADSVDIRRKHAGKGTVVRLVKLVMPDAAKSMLAGCGR